MSESFERLGNYILLEKINAGGMAEVYLSKSIGANGVNKFLAIKRILPQFADNREFIEMFKEEAKIAVNLDHNNVVSIIDFKASQNQLYIVMEHVQGQNLRQILQQKKKKGLSLSLDFIVYVIREVAAGLEHAHRCVDKATGRPLNIIHRDMSPQNIMISYDGEVKIVDFGIAKAEAAGEATRVGTLKGKFSYMSPEQAEGLIIDQVSDIFSLGIILWELIADDRLFVANNEMNILKRIKECDVPDLRRVNPTVPAELERIVKKTLMKDKLQRYQSAADLQKDLTRFLNREYPDFTPSDFSTFMKFLFESEYSSAQERMVNYAKLDFGSLNELNEQTQFTAINGAKNPPLLQAPEDELPGDDANLEAQLREMQMDYAPPPEIPGLKRVQNDSQDSQFAPTEVMPKNGTQKNTLTDFPINVGLKQSSNGRKPKRAEIHFANRSGVTSTGIRYKAPAKPPTSEAAQAISSMVMIILVGGLVYLASPKSLRNQINGVVRNTLAKINGKDVNKETPVDKNRPPTVPNPAIQGSTTEASNMSYRILIKSNPGRARIYVNEADKGVTTPANIEVPARTPFTLTLLADGYLQYITRITPERDGQEVVADLVPVAFGYITINVLNAGIDTKIYVDNLELADRPPISKYPIQAGKPIKIKAYHKFSGTMAEQTVTIRNGEKKTIDLILGKPARNKKEKR